MYARLDDIQGTLTPRLKTLLPNVSNPHNLSPQVLEQMHGIVQVERIREPITWYQRHGDPVVDDTVRPAVVTHPAEDLPLDEVRVRARQHVHRQRLQRIEDDVRLVRLLEAARASSDSAQQFAWYGPSGLVWMDRDAAISYALGRLAASYLDDVADAVLQAEADTLGAETAEELARLAEWPEPWMQPAGAHDAYARNVTVTHEGYVWISLTDANAHPPGVSGWRNISQPATGYPAWVQPSGAHDAYQVGDRVTHAGSDWESDTPGNVWEPGVFGWVEV